MNRVELWKCFSYNKESGELIRKFKTIENRVVGTRNQSGHLAITFNGVNQYVHRVIYTMHFGDIPEGYDIDHINGDPSDNRLENLRAVPHRINRRNSKKNSNNTSGHTGVYPHGKKWVAKIKVDHKSKHLGVFTNIDDAILARKKAEETYGFHNNHGS